MNFLHLWKNLPLTLRGGVPLWWAIAIGLHGLLLLLPIFPRTAAPEQTEEPTETAVRLTQLPSPTASASSSPTLPVPAAPAAPAPAKVVSTAPRPVVVPPLAARPAVPRPQTAPPTQQTPATRPSPEPTPLASPPTPSPAHTPSPVPTTASSPSPSPAPAIASLLYRPGAQIGCPTQQENCWQTAETRWREVARNLEQELIAGGYEVNRMDGLEEEPGVRISEVSKNGRMQYYFIAFSTRQGTEYLLSEDLLSAEELRQRRGL